MNITKEERAEICRINGRKSKGPNNPAFKGSSMRECNPDLFKKRFLSRTLPMDNGCVEWTGAKFKHGYGRVNSGGKFLKAHRIAWELHHGSKIPAGLLVCHKCDNPKCVNPDHLFLGSHSDNTQDMLAKRRHHPEKGEKRYNAKLTTEAVGQIRLMRGVTPMTEMARMFGVSKSAISAVLDGRRWKHVA